MIEMFQEWYENRHDYARNWKEKTGGKVLGYFCTYVPEEILYAAGVLPVRILGSHEPQNVTEPHIFGMYCPFCRDCLAQGLQGRFDYLDGIMISQSCLHIRQAYTSWQLHIPVPFSYYLPMPHNVQSPRAIPYLTAELKRFKEAVEEWTGKEITDQDLRRGIEIVNRNRRLMEEIYEARKEDNPQITGLEAMYMVVSSQMTDKEEHSRILEDVLQELPKRNLDNEDKVRLMILGSEDDDTEFVRMVEGLDAIFVVDDHCTGSRYFQGLVEPNGDPLQAIARRYVQRVPCPTKDWPERTRTRHCLQLAKDWNVQGAILVQQKFCDPHELDFPMQKKTLEDDGIKTLILEFDVTVPVGQFRIRVEAFLEMLREEDLF
jgi:benzoyl-CoA reductase subunit C